MYLNIDGEEYAQCEWGSLASLTAAEQSHGVLRTNAKENVDPG